MTMLETIRDHSVTRDNPEVIGTSVMWVTLPQQPLAGASLLPYDLPLPWTRARDRILITTLLHESMWSAAVQKAITKQAALGFTLNDAAKSQRRVEIGQRRLLQANGGAGWISFLTQNLLDFLLTDNGSFVELVYRTSDIRSQFLGFMHLDSLRCTRTGDPEIPVLYEDLNGRVHELRSHQVLTFVDMESARAEARGTGMCAASRAYKAIHKLAGLERYVDGKIIGDTPREIHIVNGISDIQLASALGLASVDRKNKGYVVGGGVAVIPATKMDAALSGYRIPIAEVPEGFDAKSERSNAYLIYANCIGVPVQDIEPLSGQGLGTGTQTKVLAEGEDGQGLAAWRKQMEHKANLAILPETTTFTWTNLNDIGEQKQRADVGNTRAEMRATMIESGEITPHEARQLAADSNDIPDTFVQDDETAQSQLTDSEKPVEETLDAGDDEMRGRTVPPRDEAVAEAREQVAGMRQIMNKQLAALRREKQASAPDYTTKGRRLRVSDLDDAAALKAAQELVGEVAQ